MIIKGKVHKFSDNINTDDIIAAKYLVSTNTEELGVHCMESLSPDFISKVKPGDIIIAGENFGCGSSREHAPLAIKGCGVGAVLAKSFAAIFYRNAINIGLPFLELTETDKINEGDEVEIDLNSGIIKNITQNQDYKTEPFPQFLQDIVKDGGLMNYVKRRTGDKHV
ncbi:MAG: 3-isopropylmalate dehydratase small subunit [Candidatus Omnitrophota bacterium]|jgi:3-isopropylmalate/(R)-2-methylmalate dehydratase small subunit